MIIYTFRTPHMCTRHGRAVCRKQNNYVLLQQFPTNDVYFFAMLSEVTRITQCLNKRVFFNKQSLVKHANTTPLLTRTTAKVLHNVTRYTHVNVSILGKINADSIIEQTMRYTGQCDRTDL